MPITTAGPNSFKQEILAGIHQAGDTYLIALYTSAATLSKATTVYTVAHEVVGAGYVAGGQVLAGYTPQLFADTAVVDWTSPVWPGSTITARGALVYNASRGNRAVAVLDFGTDITSTAGPFTVSFPTPGAATSLVRVSG